MTQELTKTLDHFVGSLIDYGLKHHNCPSTPLGALSCGIGIAGGQSHACLSYIRIEWSSGLKIALHGRTGEPRFEYPQAAIRQSAQRYWSQKYAQVHKPSAQLSLF